MVWDFETCRHKTGRILCYIMISNNSTVWYKDHDGGSELANSYSS